MPAALWPRASLLRRSLFWKILLAFWLWNSWSKEASQLEEEVAAQFGMTVDELYEHWATSATFGQPYNTWVRAQRGPVSYLQEIE